MSRRKTPADDEPGLFDLAMADVKPLPGRKQHKKDAAPVAEKTTPARTRTTPHVARPAHTGQNKAPPEKARDLDLRTQQKLQRGQMDIDATLDLHGHGQTAAREELRRFLAHGHARGYRCILVITGKGRDATGVLRARLPEWVDEPGLREIVLRATPARQRDGGHGAWYVLLRRTRDG